MKKFGMLVIGIVVGATVTLSPQIYGAGSKLLGSKVDNTLDIKLNGSSIGQGAVINGTSYLPVRSAANALGLEVSVDSNQVNLSGNSSEENAKIAQEQQAEMDKATKITELKIFIEASQKKIKSKEAIIASGEKTVLSYKEKVEYLNSTGIGDQVTRDTTNKAYTDAQAALEANKAALAAEQKNLADLQAQLAELQK